ncbi:MAG: hypothetical protein QF692_07665 [Alphaproteobacteria bacterium]|jgi:hypothetical protein|nr:hypothetical protein [Alphaproteobacteria bacterium]MDP7223123.1 hypothetical protein [Alphaproteobacteria bacterium]
MSFKVIDNPQFAKKNAKAGFKNHEFKKLAGLFSHGATHRVLYDIAVDVDFDEGLATFTYYRSNAYIPFLTFIVRQVGPRTMMYEVWKDEKGRITKSGMFERAFEKLEIEINDLIES